MTSVLLQNFMATQILCILHTNNHLKTIFTIRANHLHLLSTTTWFNKHEKSMSSYRRHSSILHENQSSASKTNKSMDHLYAFSLSLLFFLKTDRSVSFWPSSTLSIRMHLLYFCGGNHFSLFSKKLKMGM